MPFGCTFYSPADQLPGCQPQLLGFDAAVALSVGLELGGSSARQPRSVISRGDVDCDSFLDSEEFVRVCACQARLLVTARRADTGAKKWFEFSEVGVLGFPTPSHPLATRACSLRVPSSEPYCCLREKGGISTVIPV